MTFNKDLELLNKIIHVVPGNIYWKDRQGRYLGCNDNQLRVANFKSVDEIIGKTDFDLYEYDLAKKVQKIDEYVMSTGTPIKFEEPGINEKGAHVIYLTDKQPLYDENHNVYGIIGVSYDITAEEEAKKLRLEKVAAEERINAIRLMGMSIAHELRTPLRAISSSASGTRNKLPSLLAVFKKAKEQGIGIPEGYLPLFPRDITLLENMLKNIEHEAQAAFSVIDMLLIKGNLSKINKDKFTNCNIEACIKNALERYPFQPGEDKLIEWKGGDFTFHGDTLLMIHVLFNLIKNALYYVKRAGKGSIQIWIENGKRDNLLHFKDTGTGIPSDILPHIFDQFFTTESNGTGIGLAFCKLVMHSMGGNIECFSKEGEYTEFVLTFPQ